MILNKFLAEVIGKLKRIHVMGAEAETMAEAINTLQAIIDVCPQGEEGKHEDHDEQGKNV
mgnify:CR=1 FL=1